MKPKRKRTRVGTSKNDATKFNEDLIDETLRLIQENNEIIDPTRRKIKHLLQSKLNVSKKGIKKHKLLIDSVCALCRMFVVCNIFFLTNLLGIYV